ncbi:MAG: caspase, EACC1-associated type [Anaerolineales bacterium]
MAERRALVIGNSVYRDATLARLHAPDVDVGDLADILAEREIGGFDHVETLINRSFAHVRRVISGFFANRKRDDLLVLYFSGHGVLDDRGDLYLAVKDTDSKFLRATAISSAFIREEMDNSRAQSQVLILDCCHSGAFARGVKGSPGLTVGTSLAFESKGSGRVIMTASDSTQYAWEGDQIIGDAENSLFTYYLVQGLKSGQADLDHDGRITADELYDYVYEQVVEQTPKQTPGKWAFKERGEIVLARNTSLGEDVPLVVSSEPEAISQIEAAEQDEEQNARLQALYRRGLSAYWVRDWDKAVQSFRAVLALQPDFLDVSAKLEEASLQLRLEELDRQAAAHLEQAEWAQAVTVLESLSSELPDDAEIAEKLEYARRQAQLGSLYEQARLVYQAQQWQGVLNVFDQIHNIDPEYPDPDGLLDSAQAQDEAEKRRAQISRLYLQGLQALDQGEWRAARALFLQVQELEPDYEATAQLLARAEEEIEEAQRTEERLARLDWLYKQGTQAWQDQDLDAALDYFHQVREIDPDYQEINQRLVQIEAERSREVSAAAVPLPVAQPEAAAAVQPGPESAARTEALPAKRRGFPRWIWLAAGAVLLLAVVGGWGFYNRWAKQAAVVATCRDSSNLTACAVIPPGEIVYIGFAGPLSGNYKSYGEDIANAGQLAINDHPEVHGFPIQLQMRDTRGSAEGGAEAANAFVNDPQVVAIAGHTLSTSSASAIPIYNAARIPMLSPSSTNPDLTAGSQDVFNRLAFTDDVQGAKAAQYLYDQLGVRRLVIMHDGDTYSRALAERVAAEFKGYQDAVVADIVYIRPGKNTYSGDLGSMIALTPDAIYYAGYFPEAAVIARDLARSRLSDVILFSGDGVFGSEYLDQAGSQAEGTYATSILPLNSNAVASFYTAYQNEYHIAPGTLSPFTWHGYDAVSALISAIESVAVTGQDGSLYIPREELVAAVRGLHGLQGLTGEITCDSQGECNTAGPTFFVVRDGLWVQADGQ